MARRVVTRDVARCLMTRVTRCLMTRDAILRFRLDVCIRLQETVATLALEQASCTAASVSLVCESGRVPTYGGRGADRGGPGVVARGRGRVVAGAGGGEVARDGGGPAVGGQPGGATPLATPQPASQGVTATYDIRIGDEWKYLHRCPQ